MTYIPPEIWLHVAAFIPDEVLSQIQCVNGVFFELGMNIRWKEVTITTRNISQAIRTLDRLSDPFVAKRMKTLILRLTTPDPVAYNMTLDPLFLENILSNHIPGSPIMNLSKFSFDSFSAVLEAIISASHNFLKLSTLTLDFSLVAPSYRVRLEPFFSSLWSSIGGGLHGLFIKGNLNGYRAVLKSNPFLLCLKELGLELINNHLDPDGDADAVILLDNIAPFINKHSPHLEDLKIRSYPSHSDSTDLSTFFIRLSTFPALVSLDLRLAFNKPLHDPSGLEGLVCNSSRTLRRLGLRLNPSGFAMHSMMEERLVPFLLDCIADSQHFSGIEALDIYPTKELEGPFVVLSYMKRTSNHLKELVIRDRYFHTEEAMTVIEAASECCNLTSIHFNVWHLDIILIDHLFAKLPLLETLRISTVESSMDGFLHIFIQELKNRSYVGWKLNDISVCYGDREVDAGTMRALARSIPSVNSFFGRGHKDFKMVDHRMSFSNYLGSRFDGLCSSG